MSEFELVNKLY